MGKPPSPSGVWGIQIFANCEYFLETSTVCNCSARQNCLRKVKPTARFALNSEDKTRRVKGKNPVTMDQPCRKLEAKSVEKRVK